MTHNENDLDRRLDRALSEIRNEQVDDDVRQSACDRAWQRIQPSMLAERDAEPSAPSGPIRTCEDFQRLIPAYLVGGLPEARRELLRDHLGDCLSCRRVLKQRRAPDGGTPVHPAASRTWSGYRGWLAAAAIFAVAAIGLAVTVDPLSFDRPARFTVASLDGELIRIGADGNHPLAIGDELTLAGDQRVRTAKGTSAVLELADGSRVEMRARSELAVHERASLLPWKRPDGRIALGRGNIIVEASEQGSGHLFVDTDDCRVAVTGTVFAVNHGTKGSRVSVIEGEVHVRYAGNEEVLLPGQQATTRPELGKIPLEQEFAWSLDHDKYMAVLNELRALGPQIDEALRPELRTSTDLLDLAPADTVIYVAVPNVGGGLGQAYDLLQERIANSEVLQQWWQEEFAEDGVAAQVEQAVETIRAYGEHLGPEITLVFGTRADNRLAEPLFLARLNQPAGFIELLQDQMAKIKQHDAGFHAAIIAGDLVAPDPDADVTFWIHDDLLAVSPLFERLAEVQAIVSGQGATMEGTELHEHLARVYRNGIEWCLGIDLHRLLDSVDASDRPSEGLGLQDVRYLIAERHQTERGTENRAELTFAGPRRGLAGWLATPAPMGSLDYISPGTYAAAAFVIKDPALVVDDLIAMAGGAGRELAELESEIGLDVREDIAAPLGGEFAVALDGPVLPEPSWKVILEVYDPDRLQRTIEHLVEEGNRTAPVAGRLAVERSDAGGRQFFHLFSAQLGAGVHYTFDNGFLVAGPSRAVIERALANRAAGIGLTDAPEFATLLPQDGHVNFSGMVYQNVGPLMAPLAGAAGTAPALLQGLAGGADLKPSLALVYGDEDRITLVGSSQGGLFTQGILSGMGGLLGMRESLRQVVQQQAGAGS